MAKIDENVKVMMLKGETGSSIKSIGKTATDGLVDTYTVTMTDGSKSEFTVTNGKDGADFDTFEIGGRNLLLKSRTFGGFQNTEDITLSEGVLSFGTSGAISTYVVLHCSESAVAFMRGKQVTVSYWVRVRNGLANASDSRFMGVQLAVEYGDGTSEYPGFPFSSISELATADSKWRMAHYTYKLKDVEVANVQVNFFKRGVTGTVDYSRPKLEIGTKPSDWTPAPEDKADEADLQSLSAKVTANTTGISKNTNDISTLQAVSVLYSANNWRVCVKCGFVWVYAWEVKTGSGSWDSTTCPYVLPEEYRPSIAGIVAPAATNNGASTTGSLEVNSNGEIIVSNRGSSGSEDNRYGVLCYPIGI